MNTPHKHKDVIIAWANGEEIEIQRDDGTWEQIGTSMPHWPKQLNYRVKPEREWPVTSLRGDQLESVWDDDPSLGIQPSLIKVANAAIKQYIIDSEK